MHRGIRQCSPYAGFPTESRAVFLNKRLVSRCVRAAAPRRKSDCPFGSPFGAFNIVVDELFYRLMDLLTVIAAVGLVVFLAKTVRGDSARRHGADRGELLTAVGFLCLLLALGGGALIAWSLQTWASTGRLLFPYITSASLLLALGIHATRISKLLIIAPMFAFSLAAPLVYIMPNYDHPPAVEQLPVSAERADVAWGDLRLSGYEVPAIQTWRAGDEIPVAFYWRAEAQSPLAYALVLSLVNEAGDVISSIETWPGWGAMPHPWMTLGRDYRDEYILGIPAEAADVRELALEIRWYVFPDGPELAAALGTGEEMDALRLMLGSLVGV